MAILLIEHDLRMVRGTDRVVVINEGRPVATGGLDEVRHVVAAVYLGVAASA